mgnify:CR=1 FL=1|tara:strand:+ start:770 stop:1000 length:231 start_codon:yes stop_codon:yes gene_type:complete
MFSPGAIGDLRLVILSEQSGNSTTWCNHLRNTLRENVVKPEALSITSFDHIVLTMLICETDLIIREEETVQAVHIY